MEKALLASDGGKIPWHAATDSPRRTTQNLKQWVAPRLGAVKINSDASFLSDSGASWAGAVARDHRGHVIMCLGKQMSTSSCVEEEEAKAALIGLQTLVSAYKGPLELEMECQTITKELTAAGPCLSPWLAVIQDIKATLTQFALHSVSFAGRDCNTLAHSLAVEARRTGDLDFEEEIPEMFRNMIRKEC